MEDQRHVHGGRSGRGIGLENTTRWNPTKEQIRMLENLYVQGMRTPSAEQIQQITARLRAYGHIEGKNVFYWFQNHKARQREKLKREARLSHLNNFLHSAAAAAAHQYPLCPPPPPPPPQYPCPNGIYYPCCASLVPSEIGLCPPSHPNVPQQSVGAKRRPKLENLELPTRNICGGGDSRGGGGGYEPMRYGYGGGGHQGVDVNEATGKMMRSFDDQETLPLFPLTPTGILEGRDESPSSDGHGFCSQNSTSPGLFFPGIVVGVNGEQGNFYDLFPQGQGCCEKD